MSKLWHETPREEKISLWKKRVTTVRKKTILPKECGSKVKSKRQGKVKTLNTRRSIYRHCQAIPKHFFQ